MKGQLSGNKAICALLAAASGILVPLAMPNDLFPWGSPLIGSFAVAPLFIALILSPSPRFTFLIGMCYGALFHGISAYWLWFFKDFRLWTLGSTLVAYALIYGGVCSWLSLAAQAKASLRPLMLALGWVAYEFMKSIGFLAFPYGLIAYSWNTVPAFNQLADMTGVIGPSLILALGNAVVAETALSLPSLIYPSPARAPLLRRLVPALPAPYLIRCAAIAAACFVLSLGYGALRLARPIPSAKTLRTVAIQPAADSWSVSSESKRLAAILDLSRQGLSQSERRADLILWTESTLDQPYDDVASSYYSRIPKGDPLTEFIAGTGVPLLTGFPKVLSWEPLAASNAVALIDGQGDFVGYYAKMHPVPFAESIPFIEYEWMQKFMGAVVGMSSGWTMGSDYVLFTLPLGSGGSLRIATPICFEISFADQCRRFSALGAEILVNLTNVSWSQRESAEIQHCVTALYRAIENRRTVVQSTNAGVSCWIDASGIIHDAMPLFEPHAAFFEIPVQTPSRPTVYTQAGEALSWAICFLFVLVSAIIIVKRVLNGGFPSDEP